MVPRNSALSLCRAALTVAWGRGRVLLHFIPNKVLSQRTMLLIHFYDPVFSLEGNVRLRNALSTSVLT